MGAFAGPGDEVIFVRYGFAVYEIAARVRAMAARLEPGLRATVSGPWAPYHFARLRLRVDAGPWAHPGDGMGRGATSRQATSS